MPKLTRFDRFMMKLCVFRLFSRTPDVFFKPGFLGQALSEAAGALSSINEKSESLTSVCRTPGE